MEMVWKKMKGCAVVLHACLEYKPSGSPPVAELYGTDIPSWWCYEDMQKNVLVLPGWVRDTDRAPDGSVAKASKVSLHA